MRAQEFIIERKKRSKKTRGLGGYFFLAMVFMAEMPVKAVAMGAVAESPDM